MYSRLRPSLLRTSHNSDSTRSSGTYILSTDYTPSRKQSYYDELSGKQHRHEDGLNQLNNAKTDNGRRRTHKRNVVGNEIREEEVETKHDSHPRSVEKEKQQTLSRVFEIQKISKPNSEIEKQSKESTKLRTTIEDRNKEVEENIMVEPTKESDDEIFIRESEIHSHQSVERNPNSVAQLADVYTWRIDNFERLQSDAQNGGKVSIMSNPFYTNIPGYQMCLIIYPMGDYISRGRFLSVYFAIMKGDYDEGLRWPFSSTVTVTMVDQQDGDQPWSRDLTPPLQSNRFTKPTTVFNVKVGWMKYFSLPRLLKDSRYCSDGTIYLKVSVKD